MKKDHSPGSMHWWKREEWINPQAQRQMTGHLALALPVSKSEPVTWISCTSVFSSAQCK